MSFLPVLVSLSVASFLVGCFLCLKFWFSLGVTVGVVCVGLVVSDVVFGDCVRYLRSFILFLFSEAMVFGGLFVTTFWFMDDKVSSLSPWYGVPLVGCLLLISSSFGATLYHMSGGAGNARFDYFLGASLLFGLGFVVLQVWEMWECGCDVTFGSFYASSFFTVGLHFIHVVIGLIVLLGVYSLVVSSYHADISIWYWHFVDYIWLFVYLVVYVV